jgi:hypothetical protein
MIIADNSIVENVELVAELVKVLELLIGGVFVVGAPPGSGKSTYLNDALIRFKDRNPEREIYYCSGLKSDTMKNLGVPEGRLFSEFRLTNHY